MKKRLNILICDDDIIHVEIIKSYLPSLPIDYDIYVVEALNKQEVLEIIREHEIHIALLDIEIGKENGKENGIEIGELLRGIYCNVVLVYISGFKKYALNAFEVRAVDYILKPLTKERFKKLMKRVILQYEQITAYGDKHQIFTIKTKEMIRKLKYEEILYFEKSLRKMSVYTEEESFKFYISMQELINQLDMSCFIRCHQGYVVNKSKIMEQKENHIYLINKKAAIPISRKFKAAVTKALEENLFL